MKFRKNRMKPTIILAVLLCLNLTGIVCAEASSPENWTGKVSDAPFGPRLFPAVAVFSDHLWVIGGSGESGPTNDVWSSTDGKNWTLETGHAGFSPIWYHKVAVFNNRLWVIGGNNDIWSSADGKNWTLETQQAAFGKRANPGVAVFKDRLWVIGGYGESGPTNDVWSSADGKDWTLETKDTGFSPRWGHAVTTMNNHLWVIGGSYTHDVWFSENGKNWTLVTADAPFEPVDFRTVTVYNNTLWLIGGSSYPPPLVTSKPYAFSFNDVWSSSDGKNWHLETEHAGFTPRFGYGTAVFNNDLWVISGVIEAKNPADIVWDVPLSSVLSPSAMMTDVSVAPDQKPPISPATTKAGSNPLNRFVVILTALGLCVYWIKR